MSTERRQKEGRLPVEPGGINDDPLVLALGEARDKCCEELDMVGYGRSCDRCPVRRKCRQLWRLEVEDIVGGLNLTGYRRLDQKFYMLKQERDHLLGRAIKRPMK